MAVAVDIQRNLAFLGVGGGVYVVDISNPSQPIKLSEIRTRGVVYALTYNNNRLYIACCEAGLEIWELTNPNSPVKLGSYNTPGWAFGVAIANNYAYVADCYAGLRIIEFYGGVGIAENNFSKRKILTSHILNIDKETDLLDITGRIVKPKNLKKGVYFLKGKSIIKKILIK